MMADMLWKFACMMAVVAAWSFFMWCGYYTMPIALDLFHVYGIPN